MSDSIHDGIGHGKGNSLCPVPCALIPRWLNSRASHGKYGSAAHALLFAGATR